MTAHRTHNEATIELLRSDPEFASDYLRAALDELDMEGGEVAFLATLRHIVEARGGFAGIAEKAGLSRESLYRALSPRGNPTLKTVKSVVNAAGLKFGAA